MFGYKHYVPVLKGKEGEFRALSHLHSGIRAKLTPFFDITRPDDRWRGRTDEYLQKKADYIQKSWGCDETIFVDFFDILTLQTSSGLHFVEFFFNELRKRNIWGISVTGLDRDEEYNISIKKVIESDNRGVCIRLLSYDIQDSFEANKKVNELLSFLELSAQDSHIILDLRNLTPDSMPEYVDDTLVFLHNFGKLNEWSTLTLAGSGFPESMGGIEKNSLTRIPRVELELWEQVISQGRNERLNRLPTFGDYGICYPDIPDFDLSFNPSVKIRYTLPQSWLVVKGGGIKRKINGKTSRDYSQFHTLAEKMCANREYYSRDYSYGDSYIFRCAKGLVGPGNLTKWVEVDTNHHLTLVAQQIANSHVI